MAQDGMGSASFQGDSKDPAEKKLGGASDPNNIGAEKKRRRRRRRRRKNVVGEAVNENGKNASSQPQNRQLQDKQKQPNLEKITDTKAKANQLVPDQKDQEKDDTQPAYVYDYGQTNEPAPSAFSQPYYYPNQPDQAPEPQINDALVNDVPAEAPLVNEPQSEPATIEPATTEPTKNTELNLQPAVEKSVEPEIELGAEEAPDLPVTPEIPVEPASQPEPIQPVEEPPVGTMPYQEPIEQPVAQPIYIEQPFNNEEQPQQVNTEENNETGQIEDEAQVDAVEPVNSTEPIEGTIVSDAKVEEAPKEALKESTKTTTLQFAEKVAKFFSGQFGKLGSNFWSVLKKLPAAIWNLIKKIKVGAIATILIFVAIGFGGYKMFEAQIPQNAYNSAVSFVGGFFSGNKQPVKGPVVALNDTETNQFGLTGTALFGKNTGSVEDTVPEPALLAVYFGQLLEPSVQGETGITAATFYGLLKDQANEVDDFVTYMNNLASLQDLYKIDVYALLDSSTKRSDKIDEYISQLNQAQTDSNTMLQKIQINMDDLTKSYNSLDPDRTQSEKDFFDAMDQLKPEKANQLLHQFVDVAQKQVALKARVGGLKQLVTYYQTALAALDKRIMAVVKNREALIQGIHVVDVPGGGINIIVPATN